MIHSGRSLDDPDLNISQAGDGEQPRLDVQPDNPPVVTDPGTRLGQDAEHPAGDADNVRAAAAIVSTGPPRCPTNVPMPSTMPAYTPVKAAESGP